MVELARSLVEGLTHPDLELGVHLAPRQGLDREAEVVTLGPRVAAELEEGGVEVQVVLTPERFRPPSKEGWMYSETFSEMSPLASIRARRVKMLLCTPVVEA